jgi:hypothetical protein
MMSAKGNFDRFNKLFVAGTAFMVERIYCGGQFAFGLGVKAAYSRSFNQLLPLGLRTTAHRDRKRTLGGKMISGGGRSNSATLKGWCIKSTVINGFRP